MSKKAIVWTSVSALIVAGLITAFVIYSNHPKDDESSEDGKSPEDSGSTSTSGSGSTSGGGSGTGVNAPTGRPTGTEDPVKLAMAQSFAGVKKYFGNKATDFGDRIKIKQSNPAWGVGDKKATIVFYSNGRFFIGLDGVFGNIIEGNYSRGGQYMRVTKGLGKWSANNGLIAEGNPDENIKEVITIA